MIKQILFFLLLSASYIASAQEDYILFGKGGGFTGEVSVYKISPKGNVYKGSGIAEIVYSGCSKIKKKEAREIFRNVDKILTMPFNQPGNMYYFIQRVKEGSEQKYTWGANDFKVTEDIKSLYQEAMQKFSSLTYKSLK
jgi:hypothetical protein